MASVLAGGSSITDAMRREHAPTQRTGPFCGFAWAAHRSVLERHALYDAGVLGGGDFAMVCAAFGDFRLVEEHHCMNCRQKAYYRAWALPFFGAVGGRIGFVEGDLFHLWHGELTERQWGVRHKLFQQFDFDPFTDIALDRNGCWRWNSPKPAMHDYVRQYFGSRNEDGQRASSDRRERADAAAVATGQPKANPGTQMASGTLKADLA
jgi:hypothetical protein